MKGLIICGYPGIGKSSIAGWNNCIDLESSYFSRDEKGFALCDEDIFHATRKDLRSVTKIG